MKPKITSMVIFILLLVLLSSCIGPIPIISRDATPATEAEGDLVPTGAPTEPSSPDSIGTVSNMKTQVHAGARDDLKLIEGETPLGNDDFVSVTEGGKARLEFPGPISLLLFNQSEMDGIKLEYDENSNPRIVNRLIRGGFLGDVESGDQLTVDLAFGVKVNVLGTKFFIIYDEDTGLITIGKFDGTLTVSIPGQDIVELDDSELVDINSDREIIHYSPFLFTPSQFEEMADSCNSPIQSVNILRRDNELPLPGEATADRDRDLPCGSSSQTQVPPTRTPTLTPTPVMWVPLDFCSRSDEDICVYTMGLVNQDMMITLQVQRPNISDLYILLDNGNRYPCQVISTSQDKYYCIGDQIPPDVTVTMQVFDLDDQLLAQGDFFIPSLATPTPTPRPTRTPTTTPPTTYP
jgi:hypothetical protein